MRSITMELLYWDRLRVTRGVCRISARDNGPAGFHPVKAPEGKRASTWGQEPFSPGRRIRRRVVHIGNRGQRRGGLIGGPGDENQAVLGRCERGRMPGAPPAEAAAAAPRGSSLDFAVTAASGAGTGAAGAGTALMVAPESGLSWMRTRY